MTDDWSEPTGEHEPFADIPTQEYIPDDPEALPRVVDLEGVSERDVRIVDVNQAFVRMFGYRRDYVIGLGGNPFEYWWTFVPASLALILFGVGWNLVGDGLNGVLNPYER